MLHWQKNKMKLTSQNTRVDYTNSEFANITILDGDDSGVVFRFGKVWVNTDDPENPSLQFHYDLVTGAPLDKKQFEQDIAEMLHTTIVQQLEAGEVQYSGGTDTDVRALDDLKEEAGVEFQQHSFQNLNTKIGAFVAKKEETALSFLDRLAAQGQYEMNKP
jgi:hypothetical protein